MPFKELVSPSLTDLFIKQIEEMILSGELAIGEHLPTERELSENMHVSRAVINNGIKRLADMGFLRIVPRKGVYVADYTSEGNVDVLATIMNYHSMHFTPELMQPILQFQMSCEPIFMELAAENISDEQISMLSNIVLELKSSANIDAGSQCFFRFIHAASISCGNSIWPLIVKTFEPIYIAHSRILLNLGYKENSINAFEKLLSAFRKHDKKKAQEISKDNIRTYGEWLLQYYHKKAVHS